MYNKYIYTFSKYLARAFLHARGELMVLPHYIKSPDSSSVFSVFSPDWTTKHIREDAIWYREYLLAFSRRNIGVNLVSSIADIKPGQKVIWRPTSTWFPRKWRFSPEKSNKLVEMAKDIEKQGAIVIPDSRVIACYENKINMHSLFTRVGVRSPRTYIVNTREEYDNALGAIDFPLIIKGAYSSSSLHIYLIENGEQAANFWERMLLPQNSGNTGFNNHPQLPILFQEYLNIRRDLRVVFVGGRILLSYWRINTGETWKSTATRFGSKVVYESIPKQWQGFLMDVIKRIDFPWGAFDIAWNNDDLNGEPYILEVSPCFEANPPPPLKFRDDYYKFKYGSGFIYTLCSWNTIRELAGAQVAYTLE